VRKVDERPPRPDFGANDVRVDRHVHRAGRGAEGKHEHIKRGRRVRERRQDRRGAEECDGDRRQPRARPVDQHAGRAHRDQRTEPDEHQGQAELTVVDFRATLNRGKRCSPRAPERAECRKPHQ